ncbi:hypothetical protein F5B22DRAFT_651299 [Xylaria bambusicola]|uniref:uncharacterized protein n=1 Tax=Xylaria bambusicola TaxID=326684 RepID=UPI002008B7C3|nr:uncharacterized protein F5B22DRAFT_651299 [Xylaria bambusicola]KAI0505884.1 hypothetical protein F5B22DRAFT_651299 [Xylaria bambusicola]
MRPRSGYRYSRIHPEPQCLGLSFHETANFQIIFHHKHNVMIIMVDRLEILSRKPSDVVATQGIHLITRPNTPVLEVAYHQRFIAEITRSLSKLKIQGYLRRSKYGSAADEWPARHTPPEIREKYSAKMKAWEKAFHEVCSSEDGISDEISDSAEENYATIDSEGGGETGQIAPKTAPRNKSPETSPFPTPTPLRDKSKWVTRGKPQAATD